MTSGTSQTIYSMSLIPTKKPHISPPFASVKNHRHHQLRAYVAFCTTTMVLPMSPYSYLLQIGPFFLARHSKPRSTMRQYTGWYGQYIPIQ